MAQGETNIIKHPLAFYHNVSLWSNIDIAISLGLDQISSVSVFLLNFYIDIGKNICLDNISVSKSARPNPNSC